MPIKSIIGGEVVATVGVAFSPFVILVRLARLSEDARVSVDVIEVLPHSQLKPLRQLSDSHVLSHLLHLGVLGSGLSGRPQ